MDYNHIVLFMFLGWAYGFVIKNICVGGLMRKRRVIWAPSWAAVGWMGFVCAIMWLLVLGEWIKDKVH